MIDPVGRDVVEDHATDLEVVEGGPRSGEVIREHARLEAEGAVVHAVHGLVQRREWERDHERRERLVGAHLGVDRDIGEDGGREEGAGTSTPAGEDDSEFFLVNRSIG